MLFAIRSRALQCAVENNAEQKLLEGIARLRRLHTDILIVGVVIVDELASHVRIRDAGSRFVLRAGYQRLQLCVQRDDLLTERKFGLLAFAGVENADRYGDAAFRGWRVRDLALAGGLDLWRLIVFGERPFERISSRRQAGVSHEDDINVF